MSITKQTAWPIFRSVALGQPEGEQALIRMNALEFEAYSGFKDDFELDLAKIGIEAQNEAATINEDNPDLVAELGVVPPNRWTADEYTKAVSMFKGSKFEQLHLSAMFRIPNTELLLELAKPQP